MRPVQLAPAPGPDNEAKVRWLLDRVTQLCNASQVDNPVDVAAENADTYQPLDDDLTAISLLTTTTFGRSLLAQADGPTLVALLGLVIGTNVQAYDELLAGIAALSAAPGADRGLFYDHSGTAVNYFTAASGLEFATTDLQMTAAQRTSAVIWEIDGGGTTITTGLKGEILVPFACTITAATLLADQTGSIVVDVYKSDYASYPPSASICASAKPTISASNKTTDSTLTGWTVAVAANDTLRFNVDSVTTINRCTVVLTVLKT